MTSNIFSELDTAYKSYIEKPIRYLAEGNILNKASQTDIQPLYKTQQLLRPLFGKKGINKAAIGDHPDFMYLKGSDKKEYSPIVTMFLDIANSTRLNILYPIEEVQ